MVDLDLQAIHADLDGFDLRCGFHAELGQRIDGLADLGFDEPTQFHHACGDVVEFAVELGREVFFCHGIASCQATAGRHVERGAAWPRTASRMFFSRNGR